MFRHPPGGALDDDAAGGPERHHDPPLWAERGDAPWRWPAWPHRQAQGGRVPVTVQSGKSWVGRFRFACKQAWRQAVHWLAFCSLQHRAWAKADDQRQRARGPRHPQALRAVGAKGLTIIFRMWQQQVPYDEPYHLATMAKPHLRATA